MASTIESELLGLEKQFWQALKDRDVETAERLTDFPCVVSGAQGVATIYRQEFAGMMTSPSYSLDRFELEDDAKVRLVGDDVAVMAYKVHEELTVEGKPVTLDAAESSTWIRRGGRWLCAQHSESIVGDPFGRDRRPMR